MTARVFSPAVLTPCCARRLDELGSATSVTPARRSVRVAAHSGAAPPAGKELLESSNYCFLPNAALPCAISDPAPPSPALHRWVSPSVAPRASQPAAGAGSCDSDISFATHRAPPGRLSFCGHLSEGDCDGCDGVRPEAAQQSDGEGEEHAPVEDVAVRRVSAVLFARQRSSLDEPCAPTGLLHLRDAYDSHVEEEEELIFQLGSPLQAPPACAEPLSEAANEGVSPLTMFAKIMAGLLTATVKARAEDAAQPLTVVNTACADSAQMRESVSPICESPYAAMSPAMSPTPTPEQTPAQFPPTPMYSRAVLQSMQAEALPMALADAAAAGPPALASGNVTPRSERCRRSFFARAAALEEEEQQETHVGPGAAASLAEEEAPLQVVPPVAVLEAVARPVAPPEPDAPAPASLQARRAARGRSAAVASTAAPTKERSTRAVKAAAQEQPAEEAPPVLRRSARTRK